MLPYNRTFGNTILQTTLHADPTLMTVAKFDLFITFHVATALAPPFLAVVVIHGRTTIIKSIVDSDCIS